ncbi:MAG: hypothetical protein SNJ77_09980, partial [Cytophagales bacterium]
NIVLKKGNVEKEYKLSQKPGLNGKRLMLSLEGVNKIEDAQPLIGFEVFASKDLFDDEELENSPALLIGFELTDLISGAVCTISNFYDLPNNPLLVLEFEGKEILIPFHDDIVTEIDFEEKKVEAAIPLGLIDVYLKPLNQQDDED